jgi:hypothetical protein
MNALSVAKSLLKTSKRLYERLMIKTKARQGADVALTVVRLFVSATHSTIESSRFDGCCKWQQSFVGIVGSS